MDRFDNENIERGSEGEQRFRLCGGKSDRGFTQDRRSPLYAEPHFLRVLRSRGGYIDQIDFLVVQHLLHGIIRLPEPVFPSERERSVKIP